MSTCEHKKELEDSLIVEGDVYAHTKSGKEYVVVDAGIRPSTLLSPTSNRTRVRA